MEKSTQPNTDPPRPYVVDAKFFGSQITTTMTNYIYKLICFVFVIFNLYYIDSKICLRCRVRLAAFTRGMLRAEVKKQKQTTKTQD